MWSLLRVYDQLFLFLVLCFLNFQPNLSLSSSPTTQLCSQDEAAALIQFKTSFSIDKTYATWHCDDAAGIKSYPKMNSWKEGTDCCSWDGVTCDNGKGQVIGLDLSCSWLYGSFPSNISLFHLSHLQKLNLAFNHFNYSKMSSEFGRFASLVYLNLSQTYFAGQVPSQLSHLSKLVSLDLSLNDYLTLGKHTLEGLVQNLTEVRQLLLDGINMSSTNPKVLSNLSSSLSSLSLKNCGLQGKFPENISHLSKLVSLDLSGNHDLTLGKHTLEGLVQNLIEVRQLLLDGVNMSSTNPKVFMNLSSSINTLGLSYCDLRGKFPENVFHLPNLKSLYLGDNENLNLNFPKLNRSCILEHLDLSSVSFSTKLIDSIGNLQFLKYLDLSKTKFFGGFPDSFMSLLTLENLDAKYADFFGGRLPDSIGNLASLKHLDLSYSNLSGSIPRSLGNLSQLSYLDLYQSNLSGSIPRSLGNLSQLNYLDLSENHLSGKIPSSITNLTQLESLYIGDNQLVGSIPNEVNACPNLIALGLSSNLLDGTLPSWLFNISSLKYIYLYDNLLTGPIKEFQYKSLEIMSFSNNKLQGPLPSSISQQVNLSDLDLSSNNLSGIVEFGMFSKLQNLRFLYLSNNSLSLNSNGTSVVDYTLPNLTSLYLSSCNVHEFPKFLEGAKSLQVLDLSNNRIHGTIPNWMWDVGKDSLAYLNLSHNSLTEVEQLPWKELDAIDLSSNLIHGDLPIPPRTTTVFFISNNSLIGEISSLICNASSLEILDLSHNNLSGIIPQCFGNLSKSLSFLNLQMNQFRGIIPPTFAEGCHLSNLNLNGNQLQGPLTQSIINCKGLEVLDLANNKINDTFPHWLGSLPLLQVLVLRSNQLHGSIQEISSSSFSKIQIFDLSSNYFSGPLPVRYIRNFKAMINLIEDGNAMSSYMGLRDDSLSFGTFYSYSIGIVFKGKEMELEKIFIKLMCIDLSNNQFEGEIPKAIGMLNSLIGLNLSHNKLSGCIPTSIGNLTSLEWLDLSSNKLIGTIPERLLDLTFLSILNVSENQLHGQIPQGKQFNTFGNDSFKGNNGLCGLPVSKSCSNTEPPPSNFTEEDGSKSNIDFGWKVVLIGYGCGVIFGLAMGYVVFQTGKPKWFVTLVEDQCNKRRKKSRIGKRNCGGRRI
ncbi:hypothetical protein REPUB_Repub05bG0013000 [Reevesia pubescens]